MDFRAMLARSLACEISEDAEVWRGTRIIANRLSDGSHHYSVHTVRIAGHEFPEYWRDHFRYQLKKNELAATTVTFDDSATCTPERHAELMVRLRMESRTEAVDDQTPFQAICFHTKPNHEVAIFILTAAD